MDYYNYGLENICVMQQRGVTKLLATSCLLLLENSILARQLLGCTDNNEIIKGREPE